MTDEVKTVPGFREMSYDEMLELAVVGYIKISVMELRENRAPEQIADLLRVKLAQRLIDAGFKA